MGPLRFLLLAVCLALMAGGARADLVLVANPRSGIERLSEDEAINIFLGRYRQLPGGLAALPVDLPDSHPDKARFYAGLVGKNLAEIRAYWARLVFSGKTAPPVQLAGPEEVVERVAAERGAIGYVDRSKADGRVRIVMVVKP